jgi:LmbE family N-acetylglucosaminyl deacetylase
VAVALLTDGESGLDQYPDRHSGGLYADHDLGAAELARMRPLEARAALARLGVSSYIRLGLRNHPYAAGSQYLSTATLMAAWGGEERLVARIVQIIEDLRPSLVVSPDSEHAGALEHFEHAGVGHLVDKALRRVRARGRHTVVGHLRSVDPRNSPTYGALEAVDTLERRLPGGPTLRAMQVSALAEHRTQRDATVIAAETLTGVRFEYYVTDFLDGHGPLDAFLARW